MASSNEAIGEGGARKKSKQNGSNDGNKKPEFIPEHGFDKEIFTQQLDDKYFCQHCKYVLRDPVQNACGHRFCSVCLLKLCGNAPENTVACPACLKEDPDDLDACYLSKENMFPDMAIKRDLKKINTKCINPGCDWTGQFQHYTVHEHQCEHRGVMCPNCKKMVQEAKLEEHMTSSCPQRRVTCSSCNIEVPFSESKEHSKNCPKAPMQCEACHKKIIRENYTKHLEDECIKRIVPCPAGCKDVLRYDQLQTHYQKNMSSHLKYCLETLPILEKKVEEKTNVLTSPSIIQELDRSVKSLSDRIEKLENERRNNESGASGASGGIPISDDIGLASRIAATELRLNAFEPIMGVLHREIEKCIGMIETLDKSPMSSDSSTMSNRNGNAKKIEELENKIRSLERALANKEVVLSQYELRFETLEYIRHDGVLTWKITGFKQKRHDAVQGKTTSIYSPMFYTATNAGHVGYKMCARLYPNGDGMGKTTHISLFFVLMRGQFDNLLPWPFKEKVTLMMIDQNMKEHIVDTFRPDPNSSSFKKPDTEMNIASGCPLFLPLQRLDDPNYAYVKDDTMFVKILVDNSHSARYVAQNYMNIAPPPS